MSGGHTNEITVGWCLLPLDTIVSTTAEIPEPAFWSKDAAALRSELRSELGEQFQLPAHAGDYNLNLSEKCRVSSRLLEKIFVSSSLESAVVKHLLPPGKGLVLKKLLQQSEYFKKS